MKLVVLIVGLSLAGAIAWFAAEQHYENCIAAATARIPLEGEPGSVQEEFERFTGDALQSRREAIEGCSRLPW